MEFLIITDFRGTEKLRADLLGTCSRSKDEPSSSYLFQEKNS